MNRRSFLGMASSLAAVGRPAAAAPVPPGLLTPHKLNRLVVAPSGTPGAFDEKSVDCPFVYSHRGRFYMVFLGYDGTGYQTGLASSADLLDWKPEGLLLGRDPHSDLFRYNVALSWILRENEVFSPARPKKVGDRYAGVYHAYPQPGYEEGAAVIGLCRSRDLRKWEMESPILRAEDGAAWERGGLYKPCLVEHQGVFHLFYNAKTADKPWREQTGVATSPDLRTWKRHPSNPIIANGPSGSPDERFASDPCVVSFGKQWALFYFGLDAKGVARDLLALSPDLVRVTKCDRAVVDVGAPGSIDEKYAHKASVISHGGVLYHFYCAVSKQNRRGISVALSRPLPETK